MCQYVKPPVNFLRQKVANDGGDHFVTYKNTESLYRCTPETNIRSQLYFQKMGGGMKLKKKKVGNLRPWGQIQLTTCFCK